MGALIGLLSDGPLTARELADRLDTDPGRLPLAALQDAGLAVKAGRRWQLVADARERATSLDIDLMMRRNRSVCG